MRFVALGSTFGLALVVLAGCAVSPQGTDEPREEAASAVTVTPALFDNCNALPTEHECVVCCAKTQAPTDIATCDTSVCLPKGLAGHP
jgi:hypothetical protein